jgi:hypothetical protein
VRKEGAMPTQVKLLAGTKRAGFYASADVRASWMRLPGTLPPVLSVTAALIP